MSSYDSVRYTNHSPDVLTHYDLCKNHSICFLMYKFCGIITLIMSVKEIVLSMSFCKIVVQIAYKGRLL